MKQTPIEWFTEQLPIRIKNQFHKEIQEAKEMEKQNTEISDQEIEWEIQERVHFESVQYADGFYEGAQWYREQLKKK